MNRGACSGALARNDIGSHVFTFRGVAFAGKQFQPRRGHLRVQRGAVENRHMRAFPTARIAGSMKRRIKRFISAMQGVFEMNNPPGKIMS